MKHTNNILILMTLLALPSFLLGQRVITGKVTDSETGEGLIGATVRVVGTSAGAATDFDGNYRVSVPEDARELSFNYTGFAEKVVPIGPGNVIDVAMTTNAELQEVIVIGYGTVKREDATGLVQSVSSGSFNKGAITGPQELLAGKVAGVVITSDGSPGGGAKIRVRGESSISGSNDPLIVVDGIPLDNNGVSGSRNALNLLNPNDIETFTVLKDASAAAIYGNRASGGVIIITTKKGKLGKKIGIGYNGNVSFGQIASRVDVLTADEFRAAVLAKYPTEPGSPDHPALALLGTENTNWQDEIYQAAFGQDHNVSVSGGVASIPYRASLGYTTKEGLLKTDFFKRYTAAVNLSPSFIKNTLQFNLHFKGMRSDNHFADRGAIGSALSFDPTKPVRNANSKYGGFTTWTIPNGNPNGLAPANPVALLELRDDNSTVNHYIINGSVDYRFGFFPDLRANITVGYDRAHGEGNIIVPNYASFAFDAINGGGVNNIYEQTRTNSVWESYLNYKKKFGQHDVELMGGYSWQHFEVDNYYKNSDAAGTAVETTEGSDPAENFLVSLYSRLNYGFQERYLLTLSLRRDGTSRFGPDSRWGIFPAAAFAVKILDNDHAYFDHLKLRTSWGITGQQNLNNNYYPYLARYTLGQPNAQYPFGDIFVPTYRPEGYNAALKWEETTSFNAGLDFGIVRDRLYGSFDVYQRNTKDLLNFVPFAALSNLTNFGDANVAEMTTKGVELSLTGTPVHTQSINWEMSANAAYTTNEITQLTLVNDPNYAGILTGGIAGGVGSNIQIHSIGYSPSSFFVYEQLYDENGTFLEGQYADRNGDGVVNEQDKYRYKNPTPRWTFGLTSSLTIKNFDFSFAGRANLGQYVYNNVQTDMGYLNRLFHPTQYLVNVNQSAVDLNAQDQAKLTFSDHFVKKASFLRIDHITVGYTFRKVLNKLDCRLYATAQAPFVLTSYDGIDPEIGNGIDNNIYPRPRTYLVGFSINF